MMNGRVAVITGGSKGLAVQTAKVLAAKGVHLMINYRNNETNAISIQKEVEKFGVSCEIVQGDIIDEKVCQQLIQQTVKRFGRVDILINNAGPYIMERKKLVDYNSLEWKQMIDGNLSAVFYLCKEVLPYMRRQQWGRVINFGYQHAGQAPAWKYRAAFAASKAGLASLTRSLSIEESEYGITVNMICPGDITKDYKEESIAKARLAKSTERAAPVGRPGTGEDIARVIRFLCAEDSDFITGNIIDVDGGEQVLQKHILLEKKCEESGPWH